MAVSPTQQPKETAPGCDPEAVPDQDTARTWEQPIGAKSVEQVIGIQSQYAKRAYDAYVAEASKAWRLVCRSAA